MWNVRNTVDSNPMLLTILSHTEYGSGEIVVRVQLRDRTGPIASGKGAGIGASGAPGSCSLVFKAVSVTVKLPHGVETYWDVDAGPIPCNYVILY